MITIPELASEALGSHLATHMGRRYGSTDAELVEIVQSAARLAIDRFDVDHQFELGRL